MNKIYKVIFNRNKNRYEIVSELASSRGGKCKVKVGKQIAKLFMTGLLATFLSSVALAADEEVKVKYDAATGTIKIVKADESQVLASYAVGGNISSIDPNEGTYPTGTISLGKDSKVLQNNTIAIGTDAHAGDANGSVTQSDGKIAIGNKTVASGDRSIALGNKSVTNDGSYNIVQGNDSIGIGTSTSVFGYSGVSIGRRNIIGIPDPKLVSKDGVLTTKSNTSYKEKDPGGNSVIVGAYNVAYGNRSNIIGTYSRAMGSNSVAIGSGVQSLSDGSIAIGKGSGYEFEDGSRKKTRETEYYGRDWELPPEYKVLKQVLSNDIAEDKQYKGTGKGIKWENGGILPKYNNYGAGSSDPGGFIVEGKNALGIGTYTQVRGDSAIGLATGEMTADFPDKDKDKSAYARDMRKIMDMEETLYEAKEALQAGANNGDKEALERAVKAAEEPLAAAKKEFRKNYLSKYSFVEGEGALGVGRQILAQGDRSMAVGDYAKAISSDAIAYGGQTLANGTNSMAMGGKAHVGTETDAFDNSMAIGSHTNVQAGNAVALGAFSQVTGENSLALGFGKQTDSAITYNSVSGKDSTLIGSYGTVKGNNSILIGSNGNIANDRVVGLGNNINIEAADQNDQENNTAGSVFLGDHAGYVKDSKRSRSLGQVDVVGSAGKMELTESLSSTKGALRDYTKDFIYIYMLERQDDGTQIGAPIAVRSDFAGGDSTVGVVSVGSTYEQQFNSLKDIQEYHSKVGSLITVPVDVTVQVTKNGVPLGEQQQTRYFAADSTRDTIYADNTLSEEDKAKVWDTIQKSISSSDSTYTVFETRRIQNVAPGLIGLNSTDAINGSQLFATNQMLGNLVGSLKKTFGDNVTITEDGQIKVSGEGTLGWIAKAKVADSSNGTVDYQVGKDDKITKDNLKEKGSAIEAADQLVFQAGKNIGLVQTPDTLTISTIDTPSFKSVELRGDEKTVDGKKVTEVTKIDSSGMKVVTETSTPASDGSTTVTEKVSTTVGKDGVSTDGSVKVTNGKDGEDLVTIGKNVDPNAPAGTDGENGTIGLDGKNGSSATITVDRVTSSLDDTKNIGTDPNQDISKDNPAKMDRITYTTKNKDGKDVITHEVATMDDGLFFSGDSADGVESNGVDANTFGRKLSQETKIVGGVDLGLQADATAEQRKAAIADKLTDGNIGVISDGTDTLTVKLAKQLTGLDSATYTSPTTKTGDGDATSTMKVDGNGVRFVSDNNTVKNDAPSLTTDGITGGNKTITDVASGIGGEVKDPDKNNANTFLENVNKIGKKDGDQPAADAISENVVVNAKDLKNLVDTGFKLNTSGQGNAGASTVKIGDTINVINGVNTKVSAIDDTVNGTHTFHIDVTGMPISYTDNQGNALTKIGDKYYKNTDIENGKPKTNATEVPADEVTNNIKVINQDGTTNNQGTISNVKSVFDSNIGNGADTGSKIDEIKDGSVISNTGSNQFINDLTKLNDQVDPKATDAEAEKIRAKKDEEKLNSVSTVRDLQKVALTPLFFEGDVAQDAQTANTFDRKLSEKTKIVGEVKDGLEKEDATAEEKAEAIRAKLSDGNIGVVSNGTDTLTIKLAKNLVNLTSVETGSGNNKTKMTENGVTTTVKDGDTFKVTTTTPNGLATTEVKLDSEGMPKGESTTTMVTTDGVTITTQTPKNGDKPASTTETKLSKDGLATDGTIKVIGDNAKDLVTIAKGAETDPKATDKEFGTVAIDGKNGSNATLTVDRGTKSVTDKANILKDPKQPAGDNNPVSMDRLTYTTTGADGKSIINHEVATLDDGFFLTTEHTEADKTRTVLFNNTIKVLDGANTKVSAMGGEKGTHTFSIDVTGLPMTYTATDANGKTQDVHKVGDTYTLADGTKLVQVGDKFYKPDQVEEVNGTPQVKADQEDKDTKLNNISLTSPVANTAPTLSNVGSALKKSDGTRITMSDLDNSSVYPTNNPIWNNAVNVGDLKAATDAARTEVTGTGEAFVTSKQATDGHTIYNVHVDKILSHKDAAGNELVRGGDGKYYTNDEIKDKTYIPSENKWYSNSDLTDGKPNQGAQAVTPNPVDQSNVKTSLVNPNAGVGTGTDTSMTLDNVKSGIGGEVKDAAGNNTFIDNINKVGKKSDDGTAAPDAISENTVVNAKDLKNVVDTGFKLNTSGQGKNPADTVKIGDTIQVVDGKNTTVSAITNPTTGVHEFHIDVTGLPVTYTATEGENGQPVDVSKVGDTYQLADGTKLVKYGDKFYKPNQIVNGQPVGDAQGFTINDDIRLVNPNNGTGPVKITNVAPGVGDTDAVNMSQLKTLSAGSKTEVTGTGAAEVTKKTAKDGHDIYNVHVDKLLTVKPVTPGTPMERGADGKYYAPSEIQDKTFVSDGNGGGSWYAKDDVDKYGTPLDGKSPLAQQPTALDPNTLKTSVTNPNGDGPTIVDNVKSVLDGSGIGNGADMSSTIDAIENGKRVDKAGSNQFIKDLTGLDPDTDANKLNSVSTVSDLQKVALTPLFFEGDTAENATTNNAFGRKLSEKAKIVGGQKDVTKLTDNNIGVVSNGSDTLTVKLAKELQDLTSLTTIDKTDGTKTIVSGKGVTTDGKVVVNNGKTGDEAKELVTIDKGTDGSGTDKEYGKIGLDGKNGSEAVITIDRGTKSITDEANVGENPSQPVSGTNKSANMDRITYTTKGDNGNINHEVATLDDGFMLTTSTDIANSKAPANVKLNNTIKFTDGANTKVSTVTSKGGVHELHVDVTGLPVTYTATKTDAQGNVVGNPVNVSKVGDTYQDAAGNKLTKVDDKYYRPDQLVDSNAPNPEVKDAEKANGLTITDSISLVNNNGTTNPTTLKNVGSGLKDANGNATTLDQAVGSNAVNVDDLRTMGKAATTEVTGTGAAEVTKVTGADGQNIYNVHVDKLMEAKSTEPGKTIVRGSDNKYYYVDDALKQANDGKWYPADQVGADGKPADGAVGKDTTELTVVPADKLKNSLVNPNGNGPTVLDNVKSGIGGKVVDPEHENKNTFMENVDTIGKANGISENTVVNAGDLKNLVDTGFKLNTSGHSGDAQTVKIGETIKVVDGANTKVSDITSKDGVHEFHIDVTGLPMTYTVSQTGDAGTSESVSKVGDTYQLADGTKLVKVGDKFYKPSQLVDPNAEQPQVQPEEENKDWTVNDSISLVNKEGSDKSPTLKNVGSGLKDANGNATTLDKAVGSNAVNVDDLRTMGKAATTEVTGTGAAEVTKVTGANGQNIYNVHVERFMQVAETDVEGNKVVKAADNHYYKEADIKNKTYIDGKWYNNTDIKDKTYIDGKWYSDTEITDGKANPDATELTVQATTAPNKAVGLQNNLVNPNDNKPTRLSNLASALSGEVGNGANPADNSAINGIDKNGKPKSEPGSNTFVKNVLDLDATVKTVEQLKTSLGHDPSEDEVKAEKARAEKDKALLNSAVTVADLQKTLQSPLFFEGDSADGVANENGSDKNTFARKLSQKTKIVGGVDLGLKENATADERKKAIAEKLTDHNIGVISNGTDTLTIKLAKDLTDLHSVTTTDDKGNTTQINGKGLATTADNGKGNIKITTVTSDGITIVTTDKDGNNSVSLTNKGLDNGHHQIINVKSGLLDRQGNPVTLKNAPEDILNNAVNVKDLRDVVQGLTDSGKGGGFGLTGNNGEVHKSLGETITLKGGIANKIENGIDMNKPEKATTDKNTYIDVKTSKNGSEKIMVVEIAKDLTDLNSAEFTDQEGNTTKMKGDGIYIDKNGDGNADISLTSEGLNNGGNKITNVADGTEDTDAVNVSQLNKLKQEIKQNIGDEINELNAYAPVVYSDKEGNRVIRKGNKFVKKNDETVEILPQDIRLSLVNADGKTTNPSTLQNVAEGVQDTDAVNVKQLKDATKPLTFNGDTGSSSAKLGETVAIKGGANSADLTDNNIGVIADSTTKTLNVKLSKKLKGLESAEFVDNNGNTTNITGDGVHISGGNGSNVSLTSQGLNNGGNRITNVAPGVEATDAVNVSQLNQVGAALHNRINNVAKGAYGGVASAGAMASLPQAYLPGKSMVAAGASHYRGESAVALGASRISDNGKIILKLNASHNTSGNTMVGAGVGYQF